MTKVLKVTPEQVRAARAEVIAMRAAGREPDPVVVKIAKAHLRGEAVTKERSASERLSA